MMKERYLKETKTTKMAKAKENVLNVGIQITSLESVQNYQEATIKEPLLEDHGVIATKMKKKRLKTKNVLWLKLLMSQVLIQKDDSGVILISFMIQNKFITLSFQQFGQILRIPFDGQAVFTNEWDLGALAYSQDTEGPYHMDLPTPEEIHQFLQFQQDDDEDDGASRVSTPSPTTYLNSLEPLNYQQYEIPSPSKQSDDLLFEKQTELLNQSQEIHKEVRGGFKSFGKAL
ncbi:hypothetical protein Tco_0878784 [Tanacetum coccineum]|uniref:Uncharacterized protein n=1 Tax=Tanacetum coccineum TaxID=301880 RepID=A0ABQ5C0G5_9ASTR